MDVRPHFRSYTGEEVVKVKIASNIFLRSISNLCILPIEENSFYIIALQHGLYNYVYSPIL